MTIDPNDPKLREIHADGPLKGQQKAYLVLSDEERSKGFVRPVRHSYRHVVCGTVTRMGQAIAETYARNPKFYGGTFCCYCGTHFPLVIDGTPQFFWEYVDGPPSPFEPDKEAVGS
jgi:hypothetical protein